MTTKLTEFLSGHELSLLADKNWRLNNLYSIVDKSGNAISFKLNSVQQEVLDNLHTRNLILKSRQLGMSTFSVLYLLDSALFTDNLSAGIVSYSLEHAQHIFKRIIGHALDNLPVWLKPLCKVKQRSAREITFENGSFLRVDTTLRGGAYPLVLVSEFGKICARNPLKAEEVITGTLQTVPIDGTIIIESTGEGNDGFYVDMVNQALLNEGEKLSTLQYKLHFFNWLKEPTYQLKQSVKFGVELTDYFDKLEKELQCKITLPQRNWYAHQRSILGNKVKQEYPSTVSEAFLSSSDAYYFQECIEKAHNTNRCLSISPYDPMEPVYVAMDIGVNDLTVMCFFQVVHGEIRVIDYYEDNNKGVDFYSHYLQQSKNYLYHTIFLPHDAAHRDGIVVENTYERDFKRLFQHTNVKFIVLKRTDKNLSISNAKIKFERCVFNYPRVKPFLEMLGKYRKKWSEQYGKYLDSPMHDTSCFIGETLIETEHGKKRIDQISVGDKVLTPNGLRSVLNVFKHKTKHLVTVYTNISSITCTGHHKIFSSRGLIHADALCYDSHIITKKDEDLCNIILSHGAEKKLGFKDSFLSMNLKQLSFLMDTSSKKVNVVELFLDTGTEVYDLEIEHDHCYFANDLLVSNSNHGDCFQYVMQAVSHIETVSTMSGSLKKHQEVVDKRKFKI